MIMFTKRIIPCLDVNKGRVVKGVNFVDLKDAGDPVEIAKAYDAAGAREIHILATHGVFVDGAVERLKGSGLFKSLRCTNTHVNACRFAADDFVKVYDITPVLAAGLEISN